MALAITSSYYSLYTTCYMFGPNGDFGIGIDRGSAVVDRMDPRNAEKGIRLGDRLDLAAMSFRDRGYLYAKMIKSVGLKMIVVVERSGGSRAATLEVTNSYPRIAAFRSGNFSDMLADVLFTWGHKIIAMLFIATGVILVWNRPNVMLWGLAVFLIRTHDFVPGPFPTPPIAGLIVFAYAFVLALGLPGLIVFAARFPDGRVNRSTKYWDIAAVGVFVFSLLESAREFFPLFTASPIRAWPDLTYVYSAMYVAVFVALCLQLRRRRHHGDGLAWIVVGYGVGIVIGRVGLDDLFDVLDIDSFWAAFAQLFVMLPMPASVAYSVIRHRTFGLGYVANRTLVFASLTITAGSTFLIGVWATTYLLLPAFGIGIAMFVALLIGMLFQAQRGRAIRFVDRIFLPHRYEAGVSLDRIRETLRGTNDAKRATGEIAETLGLASVAVFERMSDEGFVRNAACGWPNGTAWHLLPGDALTHSLGGGATVIALPDELSDDCAFPVADARPRVALTIRRGGRVERAIFVGPYRDGARLDRDALRSVHGVFDDALAV